MALVPSGLLVPSKSLGMTAPLGPASRPPRVTIGLPVYNGERYLAEALDSLLAQTFRDFELIISDNASTDRTPEICQEYAARDPRIRYERLEANIGGFRNHNRVVKFARGEYFTWAAHDDRREPEHLARCVERLDADPEIVLCFTDQRRIDEEGAALPPQAFLARTSSPDAFERWRDMVLGNCVYDPNYGVFRTEVLLQTRLLAQHADSDRTLLAEMALHGRFHRVAEPLFVRRIHPGGSWRQFDSVQEFTVWFAPERAGTTSFPNLSILRSFVAALNRAPVSWGTRLACYRPMVQWALDCRDLLRREAMSAISEIWARMANRPGAGRPHPGLR